MKTVTMFEFRSDAEGIIDKVRREQRIVLTYRGKPVVRFEPICEGSVSDDDPFYDLDQLADDRGRSLTNRQIDSAIYER